MKPTPQSFQALIRSGFSSARQFPEPLLLLALLCGIVSTILGAPGINAWQQAMVLAGDIPQNDPDNLQAFSDAITGNILWLVLNQVSSTLVLSFCLIPWIRLFFYEKAQVTAGGIAGFLRRTIRSFAHLIAALGIGISLLVLIVAIITVLTNGLGFIGGIITIIAVGFGLWLLAAIQTIAHLAVFQEAIDLPVGLIGMVIRLKDKIALFTVGYIALFLATSLIGVSMAAIISAPMPAGIGLAVANSITGAAGYLVSAIFIAGAIRTSLFIRMDA